MKLIDITGEKKGKLTVLRRVGTNASKRPVWIAECECGNTLEKPFTTQDWQMNRRLSCGCEPPWPDPTPGDRFGELTVIGMLSGLKRQVSVLCSCGKTTKVQKYQLFQGISKNCFWCGAKKRRLKDNSALKKQVYNEYKRNAEKRNLSFELTLEQSISLFEDGCHYCGNDPVSVKRSRTDQEFWYNGIDRMDNSFGYMLDNVVSCCSMCNMAKRSMSYVDFLIWLDQIVKFRSNI